MQHGEGCYGRACLWCGNDIQVFTVSFNTPPTEPNNHTLLNICTGAMFVLTDNREQLKRSSKR
jgi:hypothetical protein